MKKQANTNGQNEVLKKNAQKGSYDCPATCDKIVGENIYAKVCGKECTKFKGHPGAHYCADHGEF